MKGYRHPVKKRPGPEQIREIVNDWRDEVRRIRQSRSGHPLPTPPPQVERTNALRRGEPKKTPKSPQDKLVAEAVRRLLRRGSDG